MTRRTDIISAIVLTVIAGLLLVWIIPANTSPPQSEGNLSPAFLPSLAAGILLILAMVLGMTSWSRGRSEVDELHEEFGAEAHGIGLQDVADLAIWCGFAVAVMFGFETIGFVATAIPALVAMMLFSGQRNWLAVGGVAVAVPLAIQQIAWHAFNVQMP